MAAPDAGTGTPAPAAPERPWTVAGPAGAPVIVFVHGTAFTGATWRPQVARLAGEFRCASVDLPGHGVQAGRPFTLDAAADTILAAIAAEAPTGQGAVVVGLSLGGYAAMWTAGRAPERVRGLVLAGCTREPEGPWVLAFDLFAWAMEHLPIGRMAKVLERLLGLLPGRSSVAAGLRAFPDPAGSAHPERFFPVGGAAAVRMLRGTGHRFHGALARAGRPILVINGDLDLVFRLSERGFLRGLPGVRRRVLAWTGHLSNLERPDEFSAAVRAFARSLPA